MTSGVSVEVRLQSRMSMVDAGVVTITRAVIWQFMDKLVDPNSFKPARVFNLIGE
jgi:hypothetical protein